MSRALYKSDRHAALGMAFPSETPNRLHSRGFRPKPLPKPNAFARAMKVALSWFTPAEPTYRAPFLNDNDMGL